MGDRWKSKLCLGREYICSWLSDPVVAGWAADDSDCCRVGSFCKTSNIFRRGLFCPCICGLRNTILGFRGSGGDFWVDTWNTKGTFDPSYFGIPCLPNQRCTACDGSRCGDQTDKITC